MPEALVSKFGGNRVDPGYHPAESCLQGRLNVEVLYPRDSQKASSGFEVNHFRGKVDDQVEGI